MDGKTVLLGVLGLLSIPSLEGSDVGILKHLLLPHSVDINIVRLKTDSMRPDLGKLVLLKMELVHLAHGLNRFIEEVPADGRQVSRHTLFLYYAFAEG